MTIKICSFDVGIVHLAFCIIKYRPKKKHPFKILSWKQIDLTDHKTHICCAVNSKNNKKCTKKSKFVTGANSPEVKSFCGSHSKQCLKTYVPCSGGHTCEFFKKRKKENCGDKATFKISFQKSVYSKKTNKKLTKKKTVTHYFCTKHLEKDKFISMEKVKKRRANKVPIQDIQKKLLLKLCEEKELLKVDHMVIENQPTLKNPRMKAIASTIFDYFLIRSYLDSKKSKCKIQKVQYMCPSNKLKVNKKNTLEVLSKTKKKQKYKMTKELGIKYCKRLIKHDKKNLQLLESYKKKDDLCDSFLQGCYYLQYKL